MLTVLLVACGGGEVEQLTGQRPATTPADTRPHTTSTGAPSPTTTSLEYTITSLSLPEPVKPTVLVGMWKSDEGVNNPWYLWIKDDQTWQAAYSPESEFPFDFGSYEFDGVWLTIVSDPEVTGSACAETKGRYVVEFDEDGSVFELAESGSEDECGGRHGDLIRGDYRRQ